MSSEPTGVLVPVLPSTHVRAWPRHEVGATADYLPLERALSTSWSTDAHFAAYSVPGIARRLDGDAPMKLSSEGGVAMRVFVVDVDCAAAHRDGGEASKEWRAEQRAHIDALRSVHPEVHAYETRGGLRLVACLMHPHIIEGPRESASARAWRRWYVLGLGYLRRRFGLLPDPVCRDWTRLYRLPRATRLEGGAPESWPSHGDTPGVWTYAPTADDELADLAAVRELAALYERLRGERGGRNAWADALRAVGGAVSDGTPAAGQRPKPAHLVSQTQNRARAALALTLPEMLSEVYGAPQGTRNVTLNRVALRACRLALAADENLDDIASRCVDAAMSSGLSREEVTATIASARGAAERLGPAELCERPGPIAVGSMPPRDRGHRVAVRTASMSTTSPSIRPKIVVQRRERDGDGGPVVKRTSIPELARQGLAALASTPWGKLVFVDRESAPPRMVHVLPVGVHEDQDVPLRWAGAALVTTEPPVLRGWLSGAARWIATGVGKSGRETRESDPPDPVVAYALGVCDGLRPLCGIVDSPIMRRDGSIVATPGYDAATQLFASFDADRAQEALSRIRATPTQADAAQALARLHHIVRDFPFKASEHRATWVAGVLTMLGQEMYPGSQPVFMVNANVPGTGKSLLVTLAHLIVDGRPPAGITWTGDELEFKKLVTSEQRARTRHLVIENITGRFQSATLDKIVSEGTHRDRVLGGHHLSSGPMNAVWWGNANNIEPSRDQASRRMAPVELVSCTERPEDREGFGADGTNGLTGRAALEALVSRERWQLVAAGLTILRAWHVDGRRPQTLTPWGGFEGWSQAIRGSLVFAGDVDPGRAQVVFRDAASTDTGLLRGLVAGWMDASASRVLPPTGVTLARAVKLLLTEASAAREQRRDGRGADLREVLEAIAGGEALESWKGVPGAVATFFRRHRLAPVTVGGQIVALDGVSAHGGTTSWTVVRPDLPPGAGGGDGGDGGDRPTPSGSESQDLDRGSSARVPTVPSIPTTRREVFRA